MYIKCTHYTQLYTLLYKVSPPPPWRWPGEQRGGGGGWCVPRPHICSTHQRCIQAYITIITILFSSISHRIALYVPIRTPIAIAATTFEMETTQSRWVTLHWFWFAADQPKVWHQRSLNYCVASNYFHCIDMHCMRGHCLKREPQLLHCIELFLLHCNALHARAIGVEASNGGGEGGQCNGWREEEVPRAFELGFLSSAEECPQHAQHTMCITHIHTYIQIYTGIHTMCITLIHTDTHTNTQIYISANTSTYIFITSVGLCVVFMIFMKKYMIIIMMVVVIQMIIFVGLRNVIWGTSPHLRSIWSVRLPSPQLTPTIQTQALFSSYKSSQSFSLSLNRFLYIDMMNIALSHIINTLKSEGAHNFRPKRIIKTLKVWLLFIIYHD